MKLAHCTRSGSVSVASILLLPFLFLLLSCSGDDPASPNGDSGKIRTGEMTQVLEQTVSPGGSATVNATGTAADGLELHIPAGAYPSATSVTISVAPIEEHDFGSNFDPVTPLIRIENGGDFAEKPMRLRIPLPDLGDRFPVAFYYDRAAGTLEAIAPVDRSDDWLDIAVRHFSEIVVSATQIELLRQGGGFLTMFDPAVNGWSFVNDGAYPEPEGMCAGMSIGAAHFFRDFSTTLPLATHFDNDQLWFRTPKLWQDDATGITFCAELQRAFVTSNAFWTTGGGTPFDGFMEKSEEDHFWSLCYAMLVINQPQFLYIAVSGDPAAPSHAIIAYAWEIDGDEGRLKVYDPNYPRSEGTITFDFATGKFRPYTSAANARALQQGSTFRYDQIVFIPLSSICDTKEIDRIWQKVGAKTIGQGQYPSYELWAVPVDNDDLPRVKLQDATSGKTTFLPYGEFTVEIEPSDKSIPFSLTAWVDLPDIGEIEKQEPAGILTIEEPAKDNLIGIQVNAKVSGQNSFSWAGFHWFKIRMQSMWIEPADTMVGVNQELELVARHNGTAPVGARFEWDFGDGETESVTGDSTVTHIWKEQDEYTVTVSMYPPGSSESAGSATATVHVAAFPTMMIALMGMTTEPPSTIKTKEGIDIPSIVWSNHAENLPPLQWNKREFSVEYSMSVSGVDVSTRISGRISEDGRRVETVSAISTGVGNGGDYNYSFAIVVTDFPVDVYGSTGPMGGELNGPAAQPKVVNLSWRQSSVDNEGNTVVQELGSVDWSSDQTELSVYFYRP